MDEIKIDYDNLDIEEVMAQVKSAAAKNPVAASEPPQEKPPAPAPTPIPPSVTPAPGLKAVLKLKLSRMMKPFAPVIRFLGLPLHEEIQDVLRLLDHTNKRLDEMPPKFHELNLELAKVRERLDTRLADLDRSMEYIKLLHHLDHNLVVEITKFRIEFETLRTKVQILEKDLDTGAQRERVLEKQLLS